ncbi:MAG: methyltransferase domain-containing protein [Campylobacterota bacterium]|nr:methyltransferase domain-containing protein [Campylobacterota bacterium]
MKYFTVESMLEILIWVEKELSNIEASGILTFHIPNPDSGIPHYSGTVINMNDHNYLHHSWKAWSNLAELLFCRMLTPQISADDSVILRFQKLDKTDSFHSKKTPQSEEKYGTDSTFSAIRKNEEPAFLFAYRLALQNIKIQNRRTILNLGINSGDEFDLIRRLSSENLFSKTEFIGIDHSLSAITKARDNLPEKNVTLHCHDINRLEELDLPRSDLIISIGTLQSPGIDFKPLFMSLIQNYLTPNGAIILGFPNCRWIDGEMVYGAKAPNYNFSEMSLLIKDIYFCKKYLQQHKFRVTITGKDYLFLTATKIGKTAIK